MALHGNIEVNGNVIGRWAARRREIVAAPAQDNTYECMAYMLDQPDTVAEFILNHHYDDGALVLAARVLTEAQQHLNTSRPRIAALVERSSFGTPDAITARRSVSQADLERVLAAVRKAERGK